MFNKLFARFESTGDPYINFTLSFAQSPFPIGRQSNFVVLSNKNGIHVCIGKQTKIIRKAFDPFKGNYRFSHLIKTVGTKESTIGIYECSTGKISGHDNRMQASFCERISFLSFRKRLLSTFSDPRLEFVIIQVNDSAGV